MKKNFRIIVFQSLLATLLAVFSPFSLNVGLIPITLSTFMIYIIGGLTKKWQSIIPILIYIFLGIVGIPVFSNFQAGLSTLIGPTGGFIISYLPCVLIISLLTSINKRKVYLYILSMVLGTLICYLIGSIWFMIVMDINFITTLKIAVIPFILFDSIKILLASIICYLINKNIQFDF